MIFIELIFDQARILKKPNPLLKKRRLTTTAQSISTMFDKTIHRSWA
jgi:hypothetical protein